MYLCVQNIYRIMKKEKLNPATVCVQGGWEPANGEPRVLPIYQSTTFKYESSERMAELFDLKASGYFYTRLSNPTNDAVARKIADLEGGVGAILTSSGQAANFLRYSISARQATTSSALQTSTAVRSTSLASR
jgi:O-acetylhomoserine/O-acetylserine sulfhydrylase-like pyridoxal-dependent enzyme